MNQQDDAGGLKPQNRVAEVGNVARRMLFLEGRLSWAAGSDRIQTESKPSMRQRKHEAPKVHPERVTGLPTAALADACVKLGLPVRVGPAGMKAILPEAKVSGPAVPARHA